MLRAVTSWLNELAFAPVDYSPKARGRMERTPAAGFNTFLSKRSAA